MAVLGISARVETDPPHVNSTNWGSGRLPAVLVKNNATATITWKRIDPNHACFNSDEERAILLHSFCRLRRYHETLRTDALGDIDHINCALEADGFFRLQYDDLIPVLVENGNKFLRKCRLCNLVKVQEDSPAAGKSDDGVPVSLGFRRLRFGELDFY